MDLARESVPLEDDATTPVLVSGVLAGLAGGVVGLSITAISALFRGVGLTTPARLVAASLMGREALDRDNAMPALLLGALLTLVGAAAFGALFAWIRRRELRTRLLAVEGVGFGLVLFAAVHLVLPYIDPTMAMLQPRIPLAIAYALFGLCLALEAPLRVGTLRPDEAVRASLA
jgi:hypothetical protein